MIRYRRAVPEDAAALAQLARETFDETFGHHYDPADLNAFFEASKTRDAAARAIADPATPIRLAEAEHGLIGYCKLGFDARFEDYPAPGKRLVELKELYVRAGHQGTGVAHELMAWALETAREYEPDEIVLSVWSGNHKAQAFYRKHGFDWVADTIFMVGNQRDAEFLFARPMN